MKCKFKSNVIVSALLVLALVLQTILIPTAAKTVSAEDNSDNPDPNFHIYIAFGQSNMEGNPPIEDEDLEIDEEHYLMMQTADGNAKREVGKWYPAVPPLANSNSNLSIADHFGRNVLALKQAENPDVKVGILVVAVAGSSIKGFDKDTYEGYYANEADWMKNIVKQYGGNPYQRIIDMAKLAQKDGVIKGIIMHQGETDAGDSQWANKVKKIYDDMIKDLDLGDNIPLLGGQLVRENANIAKLPTVSDNFYMISAEGLEGQADGLHFTSANNREFGKRYAEKMVEVEPQYTFGQPVYTWSADNKKVTAKRVCNELSYYVEEETVDVTETITKQATATETGTKVYTSKAFSNPAFTVQTKTETIPVVSGGTSAPTPTQAPVQTPVQTPTQAPISEATPEPTPAKPTASVGTLKLSSVKCKKNTKIITGKVSQKKATVKIKVGNKPVKRATVKGNVFTLKLSSKLKAKTKITITVSKKKYKTLKKAYIVK